MALDGSGIIEAGFANLIEALGQDVTYGPRDGSASSTVPVVFQELAGAPGFEQQSIVLVLTDDVPSPQRGDKVTRAPGDEWTVVDNPRIHHGHAELTVRLSVEDA